MSDCETMEGFTPYVGAAPFAPAPMDSVVMGDWETQQQAAQQLQKKRPVSARGRLRALLMQRRRRASEWDARLEEEQRTFAKGIRVFEPRPREEVVLGGIFEVLEGKGKW